MYSILFMDKAKQVNDRLISTAMTYERAIGYLLGVLKNTFLRGIDYGTLIERKRVKDIAKKQSSKRRTDLSDIVEYYNISIRECVIRNRYKKK